MGKLIDGDALISTLVWGHYGLGKQLQTVQKAVDDMRGEDAVPVIRCKDCKHAEREDDGDIMCTFWDFCECNHHVLANGYCDRAERKEE